MDRSDRVVSWHRNNNIRRQQSRDVDKTLSVIRTSLYCCIGGQSNNVNTKQRLVHYWQMSFKDHELNLQNALSRLLSQLLARRPGIIVLSVPGKLLVTYVVTGNLPTINYRQVTINYHFIKFLRKVYSYFIVTVRFGLQWYRWWIIHHAKHYYWLT